MEIFPGETVLTYTSPNGIVYNKDLIPKDKAPKNYADLIDPKLSPAWAGKIAIPPYVAWLAELSLVWGTEKVKDFTRKLVGISGGRLRYSEEERVVSGEFPIMANFGDALSAMWTWQPKGAPLVAVPGVTPINTDYFQLSAPKNAPPSQPGQTLLSPSWRPERPRRFCRNMNRAAPIWSRARSCKSISKKTKLPCKSPSCPSAIISRARTAEGYSSKKSWQRSSKAHELTD